jgi:hypothetical protein
MRTSAPAAFCGDSRRRKENVMSNVEFSNVPASIRAAALQAAATVLTRLPQEQRPTMDDAPFAVATLAIQILACAHDLGLCARYQNED